MSSAELNQLELTGVVVSRPRKVTSPAGVTHSYLVVEHRSIQRQAGYPHHAYCRIKVVVSGDVLQSSVVSIQKNTQVKVIGYLSRQQNKQGDSILVLHARQIESID